LYKIFTFAGNSTGANIVYYINNHPNIKKTVLIINLKALLSLTILLMKTYQSLKYVLVVSIIGVWGCSSQQYSQNKEYDDLYFSSKDREQVTLTASASSQNYSNIENKGVASEDYSQKNVNPEYIQQYSDQSRQQSGTNNNDSYSADNNSYYDEDYRRNHQPINLAREYNRNTSRTNINVFPSMGFGGFYGGSAFYDPFFYDPFFSNAYYDPFFYRPFYGGRPGWNINISYNYGWGNPWGWGRSAYWNDPFYNPYRAWGAWGDPYYNSFYGSPYYGWGGGWNRGGNNVIVVNPGNNNNDSRQIRYSPRSSRGSGVVNDDFNNTPRTSRDGRGGRVDQTAGAAGTSPASEGVTNEGRRPANISADESRPARAVRPRGDVNPDYQPQNTQPGYNNNTNNRNYSPNANSGNNDGISTNPRAVRPRSNTDSYQNQNSDNRYYDNNSNRSSAPTYNSTPAPSNGRSPRSDNSRSNSNWNNSSGNDSNRSNGGFDNSNSGRSYSSPSPSSSPSAPSRSSGSSNYGGNSGGSNSNSSGSSPRRGPR
jgi:hypothetical protein